MITEGLLTFVKGATVFWVVGIVLYPSVLFFQYLKKQSIKSKGGQTKWEL